MTKLLTLIFACASLVVASQNTTYSLQLFYGIDEASSKKNFDRLDSFCTALPKKSAKIKITGYADFLHSSQYNVQLSERRANFIKNHLQQKKFTVLSCTGMGETSSKDNNSKEGEPSQRRVELVVEMEEPVVTAPAPEPKKENKKETPVKETSPPIKLNELKKGETLELEGLSFEPGRHVPLKKSVPVLEKLLKTLQEHPTVKIEIQGHICCIFDTDDALDYDEKDYKLSHNRAKAVYDYLVTNGIDPERLRYKGFGHSRPKVKELNATLEQMNRRVEIQVLEK